MHAPGWQNESRALEAFVVPRLGRPEAMAEDCAPGSRPRSNEANCAKAMRCQPDGSAPEVAAGAAGCHCG